MIEARALSDNGFLSALDERLSRKRLFWPLLGLAIAVQLAMTFALPFAIRGLYAGDMNENLAWAWRLIDPGAFPHDLRMDYQQTFWGWPGIAALYGALEHVTDLELAGKSVGLALGVLLIFSGFRIGKILGRSRATAAGAVFLLFAMFRPIEFNLWATLQGGLQRSFAYPLIWLAILAAVSLRFWLLGAVAVIALLFYPPAALIIAGTAGLYWLTLLRSDRGSARVAILPLGATIVAGALVAIFVVRSHLDASQWGPSPTFEEALSLPLFQAGSVLNTIVANTRLGCWLATHGGLSAPIAVALLLFVPIAALGAKDSRETQRGFALACCLLATALLGYAAAYALFFRLYLPDRYMFYGAVPAVWLFALLALIAVARRLPTTARALQFAARACVALVILFCAACGANFWRIIPRDSTAGHFGQYRSRIPAHLLATIRTLPKDQVIAAHPLVAGDIPFLAGRSVYLTVDDLHAFHMTYYRLMQARLAEQQRALYATDWRAVEDFSKASGVTLALVDLRSFDARSIDRIWACAVPLLDPPKLKEGRSFVLAVPDPARVLAAEGDFLLVDIRPH